MQQKGAFWGTIVAEKWQGARFAIDDFHASRIRVDGKSMYCHTYGRVNILLVRVNIVLCT